MVLRTALERFEAKFAPVLAQARSLSPLTSSAIDAHFAGGIESDRFPEATAARLLLVCLPLYEGGVASLAEPPTALAAVALLRSLIEAWTHLYFIMGTDNLRDAPCRAMRLEQGWAAQTLGLAQVSDDERTLDVASRRQQAITSLRYKARCKGGLRDYRSCDATVRELAEKHKIDWLPEARASSQMTHVGAWDWSLRVAPDGSFFIGLPPPSQRAAHLNHLVVMFYNVVNTALVVLGIGLDSDSSRSLHQASMAILDDKLLERAIDGDYDDN